MLPMFLLGSSAIQVVFSPFSCFTICVYCVYCLYFPHVIYFILLATIVAMVCILIGETFRSVCRHLISVKRPTLLKARACRI